jgi:hypothetical protein
MARHNRDGQGSDQRGFDYRISFQPDWLQQVKVTRNLESGRQSTKTLFRNPAPARERSPGSRVRTRVVSQEQSIDFEIAIHDPKGVVRRVIVETVAPGDDAEEAVSFSLEDSLPPRR